MLILRLTIRKAFCNSVLAEVSRLATLEADRQKSDFISSISHELRSPLHGILGSAEFLRETSCDAFQSSLIDTIRSCGTTLVLLVFFSFKFFSSTSSDQV